MKLKSNISSASERFRQNQDANLAALNEVRAAAELAQLGGGTKSRDRHVARGKMLPRDRVMNLLDHGSAFLEVGATAAHGLYDGAAPAATHAGLGFLWFAIWSWLVIWHVGPLKQRGTDIVHSGPKTQCLKRIERKWWVIRDSNS